jgi:hypothetical protein
MTDRLCLPPLSTWPSRHGSAPPSLSLCTLWTTTHSRDIHHFRAIFIIFARYSCCCLRQGTMYSPRTLPPSMADKTASGRASPNLAAGTSGIRTLVPGAATVQAEGSGQESNIEVCVCVFAWSCALRVHVSCAHGLHPSALTRTHNHDPRQRLTVACRLITCSEGSVVCVRTMLLRLQSRSRSKSTLIFCIQIHVPFVTDVVTAPDPQK